MSALVKSEVSAQIAALQEEMARGLRASGPQGLRASSQRGPRKGMRTRANSLKCLVVLRPSLQMKQRPVC